MAILIEPNALRRAICEFVHEKDDCVPCPNQITSCLWSKIRVCDFNRIIDNLPTLEAEPVKHGRWEQAEVVHDRKDAKIQDWQQAKCSVCGRWNTTPFMYYLKLDNYCPNCGAKMDLDEVEE